MVSSKGNRIGEDGILACVGRSMSIEVLISNFVLDEILDTMLMRNTPSWHRGLLMRQILTSGRHDLAWVSTPPSLAKR